MDTEFVTVYIEKMKAMLNDLQTRILFLETDKYFKEKAIEDLTKSNEDQYYSGNYLVTAIRHKINLLRHTMTMEIVKDSLTNKVSR